MADTDQVSAILDGQRLIVEAVSGYRARLEEAGFSPTAAELMAVQYHWTILQGGK